MIWSPDQNKEMREVQSDLHLKWQGSEHKNMFEIETDFGIVQIEKDNIKQFKCKVFMNNGNILVGNKISSSKNELILNTDIGVFKIKKDDYFLCIPSINNNIYIGLMFLIAILK